MELELKSMQSGISVLEVLISNWPVLLFEKLFYLYLLFSVLCTIFIMQDVYFAGAIYSKFLHS